jgi:hypothetical protein
VGTLDDLDKASAKVGPRLMELRALQQQREAKAAAAAPQTEPSQVKPKPLGRGSKAPAAAPPAKRKRGLGFKDAPEEGVKPKKPREEQQPPAAVGGGKGAAGQGGDAGGADVSMTDAGSGDGPLDEGFAETSGGGEQRGGASQEGDGRKKPVYSDQRTAFLKNLPWEVKNYDRICDIATMIATVIEKRLWKLSFRPVGSGSLKRLILGIPSCGTLASKKWSVPNRRSAPMNILLSEQSIGGGCMRVPTWR